MTYGLNLNKESPPFQPSFPAPQNYEQLLATLSALQSQVASLSAATAFPSREPKVAMPSKFDGDRSAFRGFLNQVKTVFKLQPARYADDPVKIYFIGSLLAGKALSWFNPLMEKPDLYSGQLETYQTLRAFFRASFSEIDPAIQASHKIRKLVQGSQSASAYAADFRLLASDLDWNSNALISQYRYGLSNKIKNMLIYSEEPATLDDIVNLSIRCDNRLAELREEYRGPEYRQPVAPYAPRPAPTPPAPVNPPSSSDAMEVDTIRRRGPLTPEERTHRFQNGLCLVCGSADHLRKDCPMARKPFPPARSKNEMGQ